MKTTTVRGIACLSLFSTLFLFSCKKETTETELSPAQEEETVYSIAQSEAESEIIFNDVFDNVIGANNDVGIEGVGVFGRLSGDASSTGNNRLTGCYDITVTHLVQGQIFPLRIELDFGIGCTGKDGRTRSGKIITEYTGRLIVAGKSSTTTFEGYKVDSVTVEGSYTITNTGNATSRAFTIDVANAKLSRPNGSYLTWSSHRVITQSAGLGTPEFYMDDIFTISGNSTGELTTKRFATIWESNIIEALVKKFTCPWIAKGVVKTSRKNVSTNSNWMAILNYGNGQCDNKALLTINGKDQQITLY